MRTYIIEDITLVIAAEVVAVHHGGKTIIPREIPKRLGILGNCKKVAVEYWRNNYFRRHTKTYLSVKVAEIVSRCIGLHGLYLVAREYIWPHIPLIVAYMKMLDFWNIFLHFDLGFIIGVLTTMIGIYCKKKTCELIFQERGSKA